MSVLRRIRKTQNFKTIRVVALVFMALCPASGSTVPGEFPEGEYWLKARFLAMSPSFVEWPADTAGPRQGGFLLCVYGDYPFGTTLAEMTRASTVHGQHIELKWVKKDADLRVCNLVFVSRSEKTRYANLLENLQGTSALTIGETPDFLDAGGIVTLEVQESRLQFDVNLSAAEQAHLKMSSRLLALAHRVVGFMKPARS